MCACANGDHFPSRRASRLQNDESYHKDRQKSSRGDGHTTMSMKEATPRLEVARLWKMKEAQTFEELWHRFSNDAVFQLQRLYERATGIQIYMLGEKGNDRWPAFSEMLAAFEPAVRLLNYAFGCLGVTVNGADPEGSARTVSRLEKWLERQPGEGGMRFVRHIALAVLNELKNALIVDKHDISTPLEILDLFAVHFEGPEEKVTVPPSDVFISYKHADYTNLARQLHEALTGRGLRCWLDQENLAIPKDEWIDPRVLQKKLIAALQAARCTIFFETYDVAVVDSDFRGESTKYNYQRLEQRYARRLFYIRPRGSGFYGGETADMPRTFAGIEDLAETIRNILPAEAADEDSATDGEVQAQEEVHAREEVREPPLPACLTELRERAANFFGREITISPRAALVLLAPGKTEFGRAAAPARSDALLTNLMRFSPYCALELMRAGLEPVAVMAVGAELRKTDWSKPEQYVFEDFLGNRYSGYVELVNEVSRSGYLDEKSLLIGLLRFGSEFGITAVGDLLRKALNLMRRKGAETDVRPDIVELNKKVAELLSRTDYAFSDQQWCFHFDGEALLVRPFACCGVVRICGGEPDIRTPVRINVPQTNSFFVRPAFAGFAKLLNTNPEPEEVEAYVAAHEELEATLNPASPISQRMIYESAGVRDRRESPFLESDLARDEDGAKDPAPGNFWQKLLAAVAALKTAEDEKPEESGVVHPFDFGYRRTAIVVGKAIEPVGLPAGEIPQKSVLELHSTILANLWEYQRARKLEYDDIGESWTG